MTEFQTTLLHCGHAPQGMSVADFKKLAYREDHQAPRQGRLDAVAVMCASVSAANGDGGQRAVSSSLWQWVAAMSAAADGSRHWRCQQQMVAAGSGDGSSSWWQWAGAEPATASTVARLSEAGAATSWFKGWQAAMLHVGWSMRQMSGRVAACCCEPTAGGQSSPSSHSRSVLSMCKTAAE